MKQQWIAVTEILPKSGGSDEADAVARAQELTNVGLEGKVLDTRFYPRLQLIPPTPATPAPIPEESFLVYLGPVPNQVDAQAKCAEVLALTGGTSCAPAQPDPLQ